MKKIKQNIKNVTGLMLGVLRSLFSINIKNIGTLYLIFDVLINYIVNIKDYIKNIDKSKILLLLVSILFLSLISVKDSHSFLVNLYVTYQLLIISGIFLFVSILYNPYKFNMSCRQNIYIFIIVITHIINMCFIPTIVIYYYSFIILIYFRILLEENFSKIILHKSLYFVIYFTLLSFMYYFKDLITLNNINFIVSTLLGKMYFIGFRCMPIGGGVAAASISKGAATASFKGGGAGTVVIAVAAIGTGGFIGHLKVEADYKLRQSMIDKAHLLDMAKETNRSKEAMARTPVNVAHQNNEINVAGRLLYSQRKSKVSIPTNIEDL